jgi:hypothetical protein
MIYLPSEQARALEVEYTKRLFDLEVKHGKQLLAVEKTYRKEYGDLFDEVNLLGLSLFDKGNKVIVS